MGFYIRKSLGLGPIRLNLSKGGVGLSTGVKGARVGIDSRGRAYVHCGMGGIYYRSSLAEGRARNGMATSRFVSSADATVGEHRAIESGAVSGMQPETALSLLAELQRRNDMFPWHIPYAVLLFGGAVAAIAFDMRVLGSVMATFAVIGTALLAFWSRRRRTFELTYELDDGYRARYSKLLAAFDQMRRAQRMWTVESEADVYDRKYHAGAGKTLRRTRVAPACALPPCVKSNISPPMIPAGRETLYLLPDRILVYQGKYVGAVEYHDLRLEAATTRFIEEDSPPTDAELVDTTWKYVNKKGGPDRRFAGNRQLPILQYGTLRWSTTSGLNELHQVSTPDAATAFARAMANFVADMSQATAANRGKHR